MKAGQRAIERTGAGGRAGRRAGRAGGPVDGRAGRLAGEPVVGRAGVRLSFRRTPLSSDASRQILGNL